MSIIPTYMTQKAVSKRQEEKNPSTSQAFAPSPHKATVGLVDLAELPDPHIASAVKGDSGYCEWLKVYLEKFRSVFGSRNNRPEGIKTWLSQKYSDSKEQLETLDRFERNIEAEIEQLEKMANQKSCGVRPPEYILWLKYTNDFLKESPLVFKALDIIKDFKSAG
jgi:hypothetical protein